MKVKLREIKIDSSKEMKRSRKEFGDVGRLATSIKQFGLMHPIVIDSLSTPEGDYKYILIAGERRIRAHAMLGRDDIDATFMSDTTDKERKAMELEENVVREDMTWQEQVECTRQLHSIKQDLYGEATSSPDNVGWGVRDTARTIGKALGTIGSDLKLANDLKERPELLDKVKNLNKVAAKKVINQILEAEKLRDKLANQEIDINVELTLGDCLQLIDNIPDRSIDCLLTDPPFASEGIVKLAGDGGKYQYNITDTNVSDETTMLALYREIIPKLARKLKRGAHVYIFTGMGNMYCQALSLLRDSGFLIDELPLIWYKMRPSTIPKDYSYVSSYEAIIFGHNQEKKRRLWKPVSNTFCIPAIAPQMRLHPLQRPDDLLKILIENSTNPGELVLDCFAGSGSTLKVARDLHRKAIGFEVDKDNYIRALNWLNETK